MKFYSKESPTSSKPNEEFCSSEFLKEFDEEHSELIKFLEENHDVELWSREGTHNFFVMMKANFDMGSSGQGPVAQYIFDNIPSYSVVIQPQGGHSGYMWRTCYRLVATTPELKRFYVPEYKDITDELKPLKMQHGSIGKCQYCNTVQCLSDQYENGGLMCGRCFHYKLGSGKNSKKEPTHNED